MNEGNCPGCGEALHTKIRATIHPIKGLNEAGDPIRGLEKDVNACGECVGKGEDLAMTMAKKAGIIKEPKK
jgi:hypothetical protein